MQDTKVVVCIYTERSNIAHLTFCNSLDRLGDEISETQPFYKKNTLIFLIQVALFCSSISTSQIAPQATHGRSIFSAPFLAPYELKNMANMGTMLHQVQWT
jgi:hypothetical protein